MKLGKCWCLAWALKQGQDLVGKGRKENMLANGATQMEAGKRK